MTTNLEKTVLQKFRQLSKEHQKDILDLLDLMANDSSESPTELETENARRILSSAKQKAKSAPLKPSEELWGEFNRIKNRIAEDYETKN